MARFYMDGYDSYSGCDIVVTASLPANLISGDNTHFTLGSLQTLSISTHQDKRPVRSLGHINVKDYVMGQRTIAGSLVFAVFDKHFADKIMDGLGIWMPDEIPALNLTVTFANEYGRTSKMIIYGVKLINEGQVMSINDLYTENTYQFVALGMEPLKADEVEASFIEQRTRGFGPPNNPYYGLTEQELLQIEQPEVVKSNGKIISDKIKNNQNLTNKEAIILSATIEQPYNNETTGLTTLVLSPKQKEGFIYITNLMTNNIDKTIIVNDADAYYEELPIGYYNARYMNTTRVKESNIEKIIIKRTGTKTKQKDYTNIYPVVENISDDSITVSLYDSSLKTIVCFTSGSTELTKSNNGRAITFNNLNCNTMYEIYGTDGSNRCASISVRTYPNKNSHYKMFKDYLQSNRGMLQNDYDAMIKALDSLLQVMNGTLQWVFTNIVNGIVTLADSLIKQELMLYAIQFENSTLEAYNINNPHKLNLIQNTIFDVDISVDNWEITKYYSTQDNKTKLEGLLSPSDSFVGRPNKLYSLYGINDNLSSVKKYLTVFTEEGKEFLIKYRDTDKYKLLDTNQNKAMYPELNKEEVLGLTIRDNHLCDKQLLEEPFAYIEDGEVFIDVAYDDKILLDSMYYVCISGIYKTLDPLPYRKISFNRQTKIINLSEHYVPLDSNELYHIWIENSGGSIISKTFLFNYKQSPGLEKVLNKEIYSILNTKKNLLLGKVANHILTEVVNNLYVSSVPKKDIESQLELELIAQGSKSYYVTDVMRDILYEAVLVNTSNKLSVIRSNKAMIDVLTRKIKVYSGSNLTTKIITKHYDILNNTVECMIHSSENMIDIKGDYMVLYLINDYVDKVLGFIVIDCSDCDTRAMGFNVEMK